MDLESSNLEISAERLDLAETEVQNGKVSSTEKIKTVAFGHYIS